MDTRLPHVTRPLGGHTVIHRHIRQRLLSAAILTALSGAASAQTVDGAAATGDTPPPVAERVQTLDEVRVTAERRNQSLQQVPIAATVITAEDISKRGIHNIHDMMQVAPSVSINQVNRSIYINIRGVGIAQTAPTSSPGIAYYIDGQLIPQEQSIGQSFYDIETIEVLRGPQGTLTGQNSTGGAIYVRTPAPIHDETNGYFEQSFGDYGWLKSVGAANFGINDNVALRVAAVTEKRDSYTRNTGSSPSEPGNTDYHGARFNLAIRGLDARLRFNLRGEYYDSNNDNNAVKRWNDTVSSDPFSIQEDALSYMRQKGTRLSGEINYALSDTLELRWLSSWQDGSTTDQADGDRTDTALPRPGVGRVGYTDTELKNHIHEVNLISTGNGPIDWVVGGFLLDGRIQAAVLRDNNHTVDFVGSTSTILTELRNNSKSVFGQANARLGERAELVAGVRRSWDRQSYNRIASAGGVGTTTLESSQTTGKLALNYDLTDDVMGYVSASKGYKAGGANLPLAAPAYGPESNYVYEAGLKSTLFDRRLRLNAAAFYSDYRDMQLASLANGLPLTQNAASGEAFGIELEAVALLGNLSINAGLGWLQAEFGEDALLQNTLTNQNQLVQAGSVLPFSPEVTFNAGIQYDIELGDKLLSPRLQWNYISKSYATPFTVDRTEVSSRSVVDAKLSLRYNDNLSFDAFVNNLFDETYSTMQLMNSSSADGGTLYGAPRHYGVRVRYDFR